MGERTGIGWTQKTWNPAQGCHKISVGCKNCYMFTEKQRYGQDPNVVVRSKPATFNAPLKWKEPSLIFTCSWSDWFIEEIDEYRAEMWDIVRRTPKHTYQILTKRAHRIKDHLPEDWGNGWPNVWLGVSVENQDEVWRLDELFKIPAVVRFGSFEPLLGPVMLPNEATGKCYGCQTCWANNWKTHWIAPPKLHWAIIGGESDGQHGTNARECSMDDIHSLTEQCSSAGIPFFVKQLGAKPYYLDTKTKAKTLYPIKSKKGDDPADFPCHFLQEWPTYWQARMDAMERTVGVADLGALL